MAEVRPVPDADRKVAAEARGEVERAAGAEQRNLDPRVRRREAGGEVREGRDLRHRAIDETVKGVEGLDVRERVASEVGREDGVVSAAAVDGAAALLDVEEEPVVALAAGERIGAARAGDGVVADAAVDRVVAAAAVADVVVAGVADKRVVARVADDAHGGFVEQGDAGHGRTRRQDDVGHARRHAEEEVVDIDVDRLVATVAGRHQDGVARGGSRHRGRYGGESTGNVQCRHLKPTLLCNRSHDPGVPVHNA